MNKFTKMKLGKAVREGIVDDRSVIYVEGSLMSTQSNSENEFSVFVRRFGEGGVSSNHEIVVKQKDAEVSEVSDCLTVTKAISERMLQKGQTVLLEAQVVSCDCNVVSWNCDSGTAITTAQDTTYNKLYLKLQNGQEVTLVNNHEIRITEKWHSVETADELNEILGKLPANTQIQLKGEKCTSGVMFVNWTYLLVNSPVIFKICN